MKKVIVAALVAWSVALAPADAPVGVPAASAQSGGRPTAPRNAVYVVYYYNCLKPGRAKLHVYGMYSNYATALRATRYVNSFPAYCAFLVSAK